MINDQSPGEKKLTKKQVDARWGNLKAERSSWMDHWQEISDNLLPRSGRFFVTDRNRGEKRHNNIMDNWGLDALEVMVAGMMSGLTSPARPWFRLQTADQDLNRYQPVKVWLDNVTMMMHSIFQKSNTYGALRGIYGELGAFGTAASIVLPDFKNVIHHYTLTAGEYCIATNWKGEVATLYREFQKTVGEIVKEFGLDRVSPTVRNMYDHGSLEQWVTIIHAVEPRSDRDPTKADAQNMAWRSVYFEAGGNGDKVLRESGFRRFPALVPRWDTTGGDIYGNSPGMKALGYVKQLQHEQLRKAQGIDYKVNPPVQVPSILKGREIDTRPGGTTYYDPTNPHGGIRSLYEVNLDLNYLLADIKDVRDCIDRSFFVNVFMMMANASDARMTATEVAERHEEKLVMLGPVVERLQNELLDPLIEITFDAILNAGIAPPPPPELQGSELNVDLVSMMAQAQRAIGTNSIDRFVGNLSAVAQFKPEVLDKFNEDRWVDVYADALGIDPSVIVPDDKVQQIRQHRAQQQQQMQQQALANQGADTMQKLASAKTDDGNALVDMAKSLSVQ